MNTQIEFGPIDGAAAISAMEKMMVVNSGVAEKLISHQMDLASGMLDRGLLQAKQLSEAASIDEFVRVRGAYLEETLRHGIEHARRLIEIMNESGEAYYAAFSNGMEARVSAPKRMASRKSRAAVSAAPKAAARKPAMRRKVASKRKVRG